MGGESGDDCDGVKVAAYILGNNGLAKRVVPLLVAGARRAGDEVTVMADTDFRLEHTQEYSTAIFWGYVLTLQAVMAGFNEAKKPPVYLDLAYWDRGRSYKVSVGARHPTAYFQRVKHGSDRRVRYGVEPKPFAKNGRIILLAGMSVKGAWAEKEGEFGYYERQVVEELRKHTDRPIVYRPKNKGVSVGIPGTKLSLMSEPLVPLLRKSHAVVTRHSNVAVDGLVEGVPAFAKAGVASALGLQDLSKIETPYYPDEYAREQFLNDTAYCQWTEEELRDGTCWRHLKSEGLVK